MEFLNCKVTSSLYMEPSNHVDPISFPYSKVLYLEDGTFLINSLLLDYFHVSDSSHVFFKQLFETTVKLLGCGK